MTDTKSCVVTATCCHDTLAEIQIFSLYFPDKDLSVSFSTDEAPELLAKVVKQRRLMAFDSPDTLRYLGTLPDFELVDLKAEFRWLINGLDQAYPGALPDLSLKTACRYFGLPETAHHLRTAMASNLLDRKVLEASNEAVARNLWKLYRRMEERLNLDFALNRGQYIQIQSRIEGRGIPMDVNGLSFFTQNFDRCFEALCKQSNCAQFFSGSDFNSARLRTYIRHNCIAWPIDSQGQLRLDKDTIYDMSDTYSALADLKQLYKLSRVSRDTEYLFDHEGYNRIPLNAYKTSTGRNAPGKGFFLNQSKLLRPFISPPKGQVIIEMDYSQQEFAVAAGLSGDRRMIEAYQAGDVYLAFADSVGALSVNLSPEEQKSVRGLYKQISLAVLYGMSAKGLSVRLGCSVAKAEALLQQHQAQYETFWAWLEQRIQEARIKGYMTTDFGWQLKIVRDLNGFSTKRTTLQNWLMQTTGAEMTRRAVMLAESESLTVIASNHDALYIQCPASEQAPSQKKLQECMEQAGRSLISDLIVRTESNIILPSDSPICTLEDLIQLMT